MRRIAPFIKVLAVLACVSPFFSADAADRYRVTLAYPGADAASLARRLAAAYHGQLDAAVDADGTFLITLSSATADLLSRDPQIAHVRRIDPAAEVAPSAATSWSLGTYEYDQAGNIRKIGASVFVHDTESRLSYEKSGVQPRQALTYDGFGNILTITKGTQSQTIGADGTSNRADIASTALNYIYGTYDGAGNMITSVTTTDTTTPRTYSYTYDALDVMTRSTTDASRAYVYNAQDERIGVITLTGPNGAETSSQWTIRNPGGQVLRRFSREGGEWRWMQDYVYRGGMMLVSESNDQIKTLHYHLDHLGTPRLITGNGGVEVARHTYYPFGEEVAGPAPQVAEPKKFTGHERDGGGLDYMHARYYDYGVGRFVSVDPSMDIKQNLPEPQRWNRYAYVTNNPLQYTDPDGRDRYQEPGFTKPYSEWGEALQMDENTPTVVKVSNYAAGGLTALGAAGFMGAGSALTSIARFGTALASRLTMGATAAEMTRRVVGDSNRMNHIFGNPGHKLDGLVRAFGSADKVVGAVSRAVLSAGKLQTNANGVFSVVVKIGGQNVEVRGRVVKDAIRVADFWVK